MDEEVVPVLYVAGLAAFEVGGERVAVANVSERSTPSATPARTSACSRAEGRLEGTVVTCPCRGSRFDVTSGAVLRHAARVEDQSLRVEL